MHETLQRFECFILNSQHIFDWKVSASTCFNYCIKIFNMKDNVSTAEVKGSFNYCDSTKPLQHMPSLCMQLFKPESDFTCTIAYYTELHSYLYTILWSYHFEFIGDLGVNRDVAPCINLGQLIETFNTNGYYHILEALFGDRLELQESWVEQWEKFIKQQRIHWYLLNTHW